MATAQFGAFSYDMLLNIAKFEDGLSKAQRLAEKNASAIQKTIRAAADSISDGFKDIAGAIVAGFSVEKMIEFGRQTIETADKFGKMAQKVGVSVESLSALNVTATLAGGGIDQLQGGMEKLARNAADAAQGNKDAAAGFAAIGVSVKDVNGNLRPMQDLLQDVATKFSGYEDSAAKTALAQKLFGKSGAELIPVLNELGTKGFAQVTAEAQRFGQVISTDAAKQAEEFNDNITKLSLEAKGFALAVTAQVLPALHDLTDEMVDAASTTDSYAKSATTTANVIKGFVATLLGIKELIYGASTAVFAFVDAVKLTFNTAGQIVSAWSQGVKDSMSAAFRFDPKGIDAANAAFKAKITSIGDTFKTESAAIGARLKDGVGLAAENVTKNYDALYNAVDKTNKAFDGSKASIEKATAPLVANAAAEKAAADAARQLEQDTIDAKKFLDSLAGSAGGAYERAWSQYAGAIEQADKMALKFKADGKSVGEVQKFVAEATALATQRFQEQTDAGTAIERVIDEANAKYAEQNRLLGLTGTALQTEIEYQRLLGDAEKALLSTMGPLTEAEQKRLDTLHDMAAAQVQLTEKVRLDQEAAKGWSSIWTSAADGLATTFAKVLVEGGSLFDGLKSLAKQTVEAIIEYFAKLAVINPILNSIFGGQGGYSLLPTLANSAFGGGGGAGGGYGGGGIISGLFGNNAGSGMLNSALGGGNGQGIMGLLFGSGATDLGGAGVMAGFGSSGAFAGSVASAYGGTGYGLASDYGSSLGAAPAGGGMGMAGYAGIAAGVMAGIGEYKNAGGGIAGIAGGAAYGLGTITALGAASGALGIGGAALAGGGVAGAAAGGSAAMAGIGVIPVIGWIALAAMLIDKFSGGKLFGTSGKVVGGNQTDTITDDGSNVLTNITKKGQRAFFGGAYWKESPIASDPGAVKALQELQTSLKSGAQSFADFFGEKFPGIVSGSFQTMFDKNGKETGTSSIVGGVAFKGETMQQWAERLQAGAYLKVLDQMGLAATDFVAGLQGNADDLIAGVQDFAGAAQAAFTNIGKGFQFLALGADETLPQVIKFVEGLQQAGESLTDAYNRLAQAQAQYDQFVGQFKAAPTFVDPFEQSMANLYTQMIGAQHQANALAQAAGASGASLEDLTNIQKTFASQAAILTQQLEMSAQSLAFSLGLTTFGSLDQINSEISELQGKANGGSTAVQNFGSAIHNVAQKASDAVNLLLGSLSPLNDQEKLQTALNGLRAGTVSKEQVLEIGRRLYASSQAYNDLFAQVSQYSGRGATTGGAGGGQISRTGGGLTDAEQKKLETLLKEQAALQTAATLQQYQTLAQQIAEIAMAKGEDWQTVLQEMGIKSADLETALGLKDDAALNDYIDQIQAQTDSAKNNTSSIVDAIYDLKANLLRVLGDGSPVTGEPTIGPNPSDRIGAPFAIDRTLNPDGTSPLGGRRQPGTVGPTAPVPVTLSDDDIDKLGENISRRVGSNFRATVREHTATFMNSGR